MSQLFLTLALPAPLSSHRAAAQITEIPKVDATEFYMSRSHEAGKSDRVALVADCISLQDAQCGQLACIDGAYIDDSFLAAIFPFLATLLAGSPNPK